MTPKELRIIEKIRGKAGEGLLPWVRLGIGDDTAVVAPPQAGEEILLTTDQVIEKTHFRKKQHPPRALGHKSLARGLSDIAAMGGTPRQFLLSLCLPSWALGDWLQDYFSGLLSLSKSSSTPLVGGDLARGDRFVASVTVAGTVPQGSALLRSGAQVGDRIYVSGRLGGSALGLQRLERGSYKANDSAVRRHLYPQPRVALGRFLREELGATAGLDLSDGLSMDLWRLINSSGVGAEIKASSIPRFRGASLSQALHGGEEYELLFTVSAGAQTPEKFQGTRLTPIGKIRSEPGITLHSTAGSETLYPQGFQHFDALESKAAPKKKGRPARLPRRSGR